MLSSRYLLVICLGLNCTIGYGTLFYSFSLLSIEIEKTFAWSSSFIYGVYSVGILLGGILAPFIGKALDRYGIKWPMAAGSLIMAYCLHGLSIVDSKMEFVIHLLLLEMLSILVLYESAFVAVVKVIPQLKCTHVFTAKEIKEQSRLSISQITLMAGFASTIFWPLIAYFLSFTDWRDVYVLMALLHIFVCFPLHLYCLRSYSSLELKEVQNKKIENKKNLTTQKKIESSNNIQVKTELLLALSFGGVAFFINGIQNHIFSIMELLRIEHAIAILAGSLIGPFQVVSRVMDIFLSRRITPISLGVISIVSMLIGLLFLISASIITGYAVLLFTIFFGMGQGLSYIVRGSIPLYLLGDSSYGAITGRINAVRIIMTAIAPVSFSILMNKVPIEVVIISLCLCMLLSLLGLVKSYNF